MMRKLSDYLKAIGLESYEIAHTDAEGTLQPITKDEQLAREIWRRALGYVKEIKNADGSVTHRVFPPDSKAQAFIFERREGKFITPTDDKTVTLRDKIGEIAQNQMNEMAKQAVDDGDNSN